MLPAFLFLALTFSLSLTSCHYQPRSAAERSGQTLLYLTTGKPLLTVADCTFALDLDSLHLLCFLRGYPYDGMVWSTDSQTLCYECIDGSLRSMFGYYADGSEAMYLDFFSGDRQYFSPQGDTITASRQQADHPAFVARVDSLFIFPFRAPVHLSDTVVRNADDPVYSSSFDSPPTCFMDPIPTVRGQQVIH